MTTAPALVSSQQVQQYLQQLQQTSATDSDATHQRFLEAACLRDTFSVPQLREAAGLPRDADWVQLAVDAELVTPGRRSAGSGEPARWRLRPAARVAALRGLQQQGRLQPLLLQLPPQSGHERLLRQLLRNDVEIQRMDFAEIAQLREVLQWLDGSEFATTALQQAAAQRMDRLQLFKPFQRLLADGFQGREDELAKLRDYVDSAGGPGTFSQFRLSLNPSHGPASALMIHGPGGIGKSTLLAQFLTLHCGPGADPARPFVYIDIDRLGFQADDPGRFLLEAMRQLGRQIVESMTDYVRERQDMESALRKTRNIGAASGTPTEFIHVWTIRFANWISRTPEFRYGTLPFVVDTFEEIQRRGPEDERAAWSLFDLLRNRISQLRLIVSGRARSEGVSALRTIELHGLQRRASETLVDAYLTRHGQQKLHGPDRARLLDIANDNPLSLRLALRLLRQHGVAALADIGTRQWLMFRISDEQIQAQLHARVLSHIDDDEVRRLAYPGLAVRRFTPDVIAQVLAGPCQLTVRDATHAQQLFDKLRLEVGLVEPAPDGSLLHLSHVRRLMLENLLAQAGAQTVRKIDTAAVAYYETQESAEARAEEIYHRLRLGQSGTQIDRRWRNDAAPFLAGSLDELPVPGRLYLASRLNLSVSDELRRSADQATWERLTARTARNALNRGDIPAAKASLGERRELLRGSALWEIQAEVLRRNSEFQPAVDVVEHATQVGGFTAQQTAALQLVALLATEYLQHYPAAVDWHATLQALDPFHDDELLKLRIATAGDRLRRKLSATTVEPLSADALATLRHKLGLAKTLDRPFAPAQLPPALRRRNGQINLNVLRQLKSRPALLREVVAEFGLLQPEILYFGLEQLGMPGVGKTDWALLIARELDDANAWGSDQELRLDLAAKLRAQSDTVARAMAQSDVSANSANAELQDGAFSGSVSAEVLDSLINWLRHDADARDLRDLIVRGFRNDVDLVLGNAALTRTVYVTRDPLR